MSDYDTDNSSDYVYESDEDDILILDEPVTKKSTFQKSYTIRNVKDLEETVKSEISKICDVLGVERDIGRIILMRYQWNQEEVMNLFFSKGLDLIFEDCGILTPMKPVFGKSDEPVECEVCYLETSEPWSTFCGHKFCNFCWEQYMKINILEGKSTSIKCMSFKCNAVCSERLVLATAPKEVIQKYQTALRDSFVNDNPSLMWCQSVPHCGKAIQIAPNISNRIEVECDCTEVFCFRCGKNAHSPLPCEWLKSWEIKNEGESETANFLVSKCKPCPKCGKFVEKNGGCNHVQCICGQSMCWLCGEATGVAHSWDSIDGHTCGSYEEKETNANEAAKVLERYLFYFTRYQAHIESLKTSSALRLTVDKTITQLEQGTSSGAVSEDAPHADWLKIGLEQLLRMRSVLAHSYVFSYYCFNKDVPASFSKLKEGMQKSLKLEDLTKVYEEIQAQLEFNVEKLSGFVEEPADKMTAATKAGVLQFTTVTHSNCQALFELIQTEIMSTGKIGVDIANYDPIRILTTGLGIIGNSQNPTYSRR